METITLGRTGLKVSVAGLGSGGASRLGMARGLSAEQAAVVCRAALDQGITLIDTARNYGNEHVVGAALAGRRQDVVLSSKSRLNPPGVPFDSDVFLTRAQFVEAVETSLRELRTDYLDILHLHGVRPHQYDYARSEIVPAMLDLRQQGKIRFLGMTEGFGADRQHATLSRAVADGAIDVIMPGLNVLNPSALRTLLPAAHAANVGTLCMHAVRGALTRADLLSAKIEKLIASGEVSREEIAAADPVALLAAAGAEGAIADAAYRFCRHSPGIDVVLFGTGNVGHVGENILSINGPPLPEATRTALLHLFRNVESEAGDA